MRERLFRFQYLTPKKVNRGGEVIWEYPATEIGIAFVQENEAPLHHHNQTREWYIVTRGQGAVEVEDRSYSLVPGDVLYIPPGLKHKARKTAPHFEMFVISSPPFSTEDYFLDEHPAKRGKSF